MSEISTAGRATGNTGRGAQAALWVMQVLAAAMFVFTGLGKIGAEPAQVAGFEAMGLGVKGMYVIGTLELAGAVGLLLPGACGFAALCLVALMVGAVIATVATMGLVPLVAVPAVTLVLVAVIAWGRRRRTTAFVRLLLRPASPSVCATPSFTEQMPPAGLSGPRGRTGLSEVLRNTDS